MTAAGTKDGMRSGPPRSLSFVNRRQAPGTTEPGGSRKTSLSDQPVSGPKVWFSLPAPPSPGDLGSWFFILNLCLGQPGLHFSSAAGAWNCPAASQGHSEVAGPQMRLRASSGLSGRSVTPAGGDVSQDLESVLRNIPLSAVPCSPGSV